MKCPHCMDNFHDSYEDIILGKDLDGGWKLVQRKCPSCDRFILHLINGVAEPFNSASPMRVNQFVTSKHSKNVSNVVEGKKILVHPRGISRTPCPIEVPVYIAEDYIEACLILADSAKASAALSRRCLQNVLRDTAKVKRSDLAKEIQQVVTEGKLPSYIADDLDNVRLIGNFAAHPEKAISTGEIVPVEPEEAEWTLSVLQALFDFYYVQPVLAQKRRDAFNTKLQDTTKNSKQ